MRVLVRVLLGAATLSLVVSLVNFRLHWLGPWATVIASAVIAIAFMAVGLVVWGYSTNYQTGITRKIGHIPLWERVLCVCVVLAGWATGVISMMFLGKGSPGRDRAGCDFYVVNRGSYTCVSERDYASAVYAQPLIVLGVVTALCGLLALVILALLKEDSGDNSSAPVALPRLFLQGEDAGK